MDMALGFSARLLATIVEWDALLETAASAFVAGVGVTLVFSLAIFGVAQFAAARRDGRPLAVGATALLAVLALAVSLGGVAVGLVVMTSK
jgi:hypothetical protein